jgi:hypothetical protein
MDMRPHRKNEAGGIPLFVILGLMPVLLWGFVLIFILMVSSVTIAPSTISGDPGSTLTQGGNGEQSMSNTEIEIPSNLDAGGAGLVCVHLPGINRPRTAALDRRVARRYAAVMNTLQSEGINITFTWAFRTKCQQINVNPGTNLKAKPGTSPHEAGRAVDVNGMKVNPKRGRIISVFKQFGWRWLGHKDPPHFEIPAETVGEASRFAMISKNQSDFQRGNPAPCRGTDCGR